jgi:hypothetical protein
MELSSADRELLWLESQRAGKVRDSIARRTLLKQFVLAIVLIVLTIAFAMVFARQTEELVLPLKPPVSVRVGLMRWRGGTHDGNYFECRKVLVASGGIDRIDLYPFHRDLLLFHWFRYLDVGAGSDVVRHPASKLLLGRGISCSYPRFQPLLYGGQNIPLARSGVHYKSRDRLDGMAHSTDIRGRVAGTESNSAPNVPLTAPRQLTILGHFFLHSNLPEAPKGLSAQQPGGWR